MTAEILADRRQFRLRRSLGLVKHHQSTVWEELKSIGYDPKLNRLEAVVDVKQATGYGGTLCELATREYVRFYVDFKDGHGFRDIGMASFKAANISDAPPGPQHPLSYRAFLPIPEQHRWWFSDCTHAVILKVRGILSWNCGPEPDNAGYVPEYGNVCDVDIQLRNTLTLPPWKRPVLMIPPHEPKPMPPLPEKPHMAELYKLYRESGVPNHRLFFSTVGKLVDLPVSFKKATATFNVADMIAAKIDPKIILELLKPLPNEKDANVTYEQVCGVGLNPDTDTVNAVVHIKKPCGFNGNLCETGSQEHVAFWADWDNNGVFEDYLGTVDLEIHDMSNIPPEGLYYAVTCPLSVGHRLKRCSAPNVIRVRAVLSWEASPSDTDPNVLNPWGNRIDAAVQLRPSAQVPGITSVITHVGNVERGAIDETEHLYNYDAVAPTMDHNRPWGGVVNIRGIIDRKSFPNVVKYRVLYKAAGSPDTDFEPVSWHEHFARWNSYTLTLSWPEQSADAEGWFIYDVNTAIGVFDADDNHLANFSTSGLSDGEYTLRFEHTDEHDAVVLGDEFTIVVCNKGMTVSPLPGATVNMGYDLDLVIDGGDCHSYNAADPLVRGHVRATHPFIARWTLDLQPSGHAHGITANPPEHLYNAIGDTGDGNSEWTVPLIDPGPPARKLDSCGYTASLTARTRVILNSTPGWYPWYGTKAVGFAVQI